MKVENRVRELTQEEMESVEGGIGFLLFALLKSDAPSSPKKESIGTQEGVDPGADADTDTDGTNGVMMNPDGSGCTTF
jgi:hypothetical protein